MNPKDFHLHHSKRLLLISLSFGECLTIESNHFILHDIEIKLFGSNRKFWLYHQTYYELTLCYSLFKFSTLLKILVRIIAFLPEIG